MYIAFDWMTLKVKVTQNDVSKASVHNKLDVLLYEFDKT